MTVPYATNDAVETSAHGTNVSVNARGNYSIRIGDRSDATSIPSVGVPEKAIYDGETIEIQFETGSRRPRR